MSARTSFTSYRGYGFWASNVYVQTWLCIMAEHIGRLSGCPDWLHETREHWLSQGTESVEGPVLPDLDDYLGDDRRREFILQLSIFAFDRLKKMGPSVPIEYLRSIGAEQPGTMYLKAPPSESFVAYGEKWIMLLRGEPKLSTSAAPDRIMIDPRKRN